MRASKLRSNTPGPAHAELCDAAGWKEGARDALAVDGLDLEYALLLNTPTLNGVIRMRGVMQLNNSTKNKHLRNQRKVSTCRCERSRTSIPHPEQQRTPGDDGQQQRRA